MSQTQDSQPNEFFNQMLVEYNPSQDRCSGKSNISSPSSSKAPSSQNTFHKLEEALDSREEEIKALRKAARDTFESKEIEINNAKSAIDSLQTEISEIQSQLSDLSDDKEKTLESLRIAQDHLEDKQRELIEVNAALKKLESERNQLLEENTSLKEEVSNRKSESSLLQEQLEGVKEDLEKAVQQIEGFQNILDEKDSEIKDLEEKMEMQKSEQEDTNKQYERTIAEANGEIKSLNRELELLRSGERKEKDNNSSKSEEITKLQSEISHLQHNNNELQVQMELVREDMNQISEAANRQTEDLEKSNDENNKLKSKIEEITSQLEICRKNLSEAQAKVEEAQHFVAPAVIPQKPAQEVAKDKEEDIVVPDQSEDRPQPKSLSFSSELDFEEVNAIIEDGKNDIIKFKQQEIDRLKQRAVGYHDEIAELRRQLSVKMKTEADFRKDFDKAIERFRTELLFKEEEIRNLALEKYLSSEESDGGNSSESDAESGLEDRTPNQSPSKKMKRKRVEAPTALKAFEQSLNFNSKKKTRVVRVGKDLTTIFTSVPSRITIQPE